VAALDGGWGLNVEARVTHAFRMLSIGPRTERMRSRSPLIFATTHQMTGRVPRPDQNF
jgi:hypothetical protein